VLGGDGMTVASSIRLTRFDVNWGEPGPDCIWDLEIGISLSDDLGPAARLLGATGSALSVPIHRARQGVNDRLPELISLRPVWYSTPEASAKLGLTQWDVWRAIVRGDLTATQARTRGQCSF
jgi:hypothetical protein